MSSTSNNPPPNPYDPNFKPNDLLNIPLNPSLGTLPNSGPVPSASGGAIPDLFQYRSKAKETLLGKEAQGPEHRPKLGMRDKEERKKVKVDIIREVKERNKEREEEELGNEVEKSPGRGGVGAGIREREKKPYSYSGDNRSMRKLLAKRRKEEEELEVIQEEEGRSGSGVGRENGASGLRTAAIQQQEDDDMMDSTEDDATPQPNFQHQNKPQTNFAPIYAARVTHEHESSRNLAAASPIDPFGTSNGGRVTSSGRVGRPKRERPGKVVIRGGAAAAAAGSGFEDQRRSTGPIRVSGSKFSAKFDEEEEEAMREAGGKEGQEKIQPRYEAPSGFSFAMPVCQFSHFLTSNYALIDCSCSCSV